VKLVTQRPTFRAVLDLQVEAIGGEIAAVMIAAVAFELSDLLRGAILWFGL
jgi:hypothetical protein